MAGRMKDYAPPSATIPGQNFGTNQPAEIHKANVEGARKNAQMRAKNNKRNAKRKGKKENFNEFMGKVKRRAAVLKRDLKSEKDVADVVSTMGTDNMDKYNGFKVRAASATSVDFGDH